MIDTFQLVRERCLLSNLNIRTEMFGDEKKTAVDIQFDFSGANNLLAKLHPELRASLYKAQDTADMLNADHLPVLRYPLMGPISWDLEIPRTLLRLHGEEGSPDVLLGGGKTNKFKLHPLDGGTVKWHFRCQFSKVSDADIAGLSRFLNDNVPVSLECKEAEEEPDNFEQVEQLSLAGPISEARQKAEDLFAKPGDGVDSLFEQAGTDLVLANNGVQPGDPEHSYTAQPGDGDVVDAEFVPPAAGSATVVAVDPGDPAGDQHVEAKVDTATGQVVDIKQIKGKRGSGRKAAGASLE